MPLKTKLVRGEVQKGVERWLNCLDPAPGEDAPEVRFGRSQGAPIGVEGLVIKSVYALTLIGLENATRPKSKQSLLFGGRERCTRHQPLRKKHGFLCAELFLQAQRLSPEADTRLAPGGLSEVLRLTRITLLFRPG